MKVQIEIKNTGVGGVWGRHGAHQFDPSGFEVLMQEKRVCMAALELGPINMWAGQAQLHLPWGKGGVTGGRWAKQG